MKAKLSIMSIAFVILAGMFVTGAIACNQAAGKLEILSQRMGQSNTGQPFVEGVAKNVGSLPLSYAEIKVEFLDTNNDLRGSRTDNVSDLAAGESWNFQVEYPNNDPGVVTQYKIITNMNP